MNPTTIQESYQITQPVVCAEVTTDKPMTGDTTAGPGVQTIQQSGQPEALQQQDIKVELQPTTRLTASIAVQHISGYILFFLDTKQLLLAEYPQIPLIPLTRIISKRWKKLENEIQQGYFDRANDDMHSYTEEDVRTMFDLSKDSDKPEVPQNKVKKERKPRKPKQPNEVKQKQKQVKKRTAKSKDSEAKKASRKPRTSKQAVLVKVEEDLMNNQLEFNDAEIPILPEGILKNLAKLEEEIEEEEFRVEIVNSQVQIGSTPGQLSSQQQIIGNSDFSSPNSCSVSYKQRPGESSSELVNASSQHSDSRKGLDKNSNQESDPA